MGSFVVFSIAAEESNVETEWWVGKLSEASFAFKFREPTSDEIKKVRQAELGRVSSYSSYFTSITPMTHNRNFKQDSHS